MFLKGSKSSRDAKGLGLTAGLAMAGAEENVLIPNGSSFNPELVLKLSLKFGRKKFLKYISLLICIMFVCLFEWTHYIGRKVGIPT